MSGLRRAGCCPWRVTCCRIVPNGGRVKEENVKTYQLVRTTTENSLGWYETEDDALQEVANEVDAVGADRAARNTALHRVTAEGDELVAEGQALVRRAVARFPRRQLA